MTGYALYFSNRNADVSKRAYDDPNLRVAEIADQIDRLLEKSRSALTSAVSRISDIVETARADVGSPLTEVERLMDELRSPELYSAGGSTAFQDAEQKELQIVQDFTQLMGTTPYF